MAHVIAELRQAFRSLRRGGSTTIAAFLTLALGLGISSALMAVVDGVLLRPLPYPDSGQLVLVSEHRPGATGGIGGVLSSPTAEAWRHGRTIEGLAAFSARGFVWARPDGAERLAGARVSPEAFNALRVRPFRGRFFAAAEEEEGRDGVVVLSHGLWQERFGGQDEAIGRTLRLDDRVYTIVGIAPPGFAFPSREARLWTPQTRVAPTASDNGPVRVFQAMARLRPGVSPVQAAAEGTAAARTVKGSVVTDLLFGKGGPMEVEVVSMLDDAVAAVRPALIALTAGVALLLLVACANVGNLLLAAGVARRRELAVRAAIGASRGQLLRLMAIEAALLAAAGLAAGWLLAGLLIDALPAIAPADFPRLDNVAVSLRVVAASGGAAALTVLLAGLLPAWRASRVRAASALKDDDGRSAGETGARLRSTLLVAEAALALVLVVGALLLARSVDRLRRVDPGYDPTNVIAARIDVTGAAAEHDRRVALVDGILRRVRALPGVVAAGASNMAPFGETISLSSFRLPFPGPDGEPRQAQADSHVVTPGFAEALGLRLVEGRSFTATDPTRGAPLLVNETFARLYLRDGRPIAGRAFPLDLREGIPPASTIAGVIHDVHPGGPRSEPRAEVYLLAGPDQPIEGAIQLIVRTTGDPLALAPALRQVVRTEERGAAIDQIGTLASRLSTSVATPRFFAVLLAVFAGLALALAALGLYGVLAYSVRLRQRELGIRAALGAGRGDLLAMIVRQGLAPTLAGLALGVPLSLTAGWLMRSLLFGVGPADPVSFVAAAGALVTVALAACLLPARRAAASDPGVTLRE